MTEPVPLVTDLDDTLIHGDLLLDSILAGLGRAPVTTMRLVIRHLRAPQVLKIRLADRFPLDLDAIPRNPDVEAALAEARATGRKIVLASGSTKALVQSFAERYGAFDAVFASDDITNLTGSRKASLLVGEYGARGFDYIGDTGKDIKVWQSARKALVARRGPRFHARLRAKGIEPTGIGAAITLGGLASAALRPALLVGLGVMILLVTAYAGPTLATVQLLAGPMSLLAALDIYRMLTHPDMRRRPAAFRQGRARLDHLIVTATVLGALGALTMATQGLLHAMAASALTLLAIFGPRLRR